MEPELLAFDEPSSGLDPASRRDFIELVRTLPQTKVIATHDMDLAYELCGRVVIMDHGRIFADGPRDAILGDRELLEGSPPRTTIAPAPRSKKANDHAGSMKQVFFLPVHRNPGRRQTKRKRNPSVLGANENG